MQVKSLSARNLMSLALTTDLLIKSVGKQVKNTGGIYLGKIIEITRNESGSSIEYAILRSDLDDRHFAIPVSSRFIKITEAGQIVLQMSKKELYLVNGIQYEKCLSPNFQSNPSVFELIE